MAVTVLKNIKEAKNRSPSAHLKNAIQYIMNPAKTEDGLWIGGNVGLTPDKAYHAMMETKNEFGKLYGRQGYHFVISFAPGEADPETTFLIGQEFCRQYFGDDYEYAFAVHTDQHHSHCHIVFNSINRFDGKKYRYINGDWEAYIQPITDKLCVKRGLPALEYDRKDKKGKSYAEWLAEKEGRITGKDIIRQDIDAAIRAAGTYDEFILKMQAMGYRIRQGYSEAKGKPYLTFHAPGLEKGRRDYNLGRGYSLEDIKKRINGEMMVVPCRLHIPAKLEIQNLWDGQKSKLQKAYVLRVIRAVFYHSINPYNVNHSEVRKDLLEIRKLSEECSYLEDHGIRELDHAESQLAALQKEEREVRKKAGSTERLKVISREKKILRRVLKRKAEYSTKLELPDDQIRGFLLKEREPEITMITEHGKKNQL